MRATCGWSSRCAALGTLGIAVERTRPFLECLAAGNENADECPASMAGYRDAISELTERIEALTTRREILVRRLQQAARVVETTPWICLCRTTAAEPITSRRRMPGLVFPSTDGRHERLGRLGPGTSIVYLYPLTGRPDVDLPEGWDTIPGARGCTPQACGFRDHHQELVEAGAARVFGLSTQDSGYQRELVDRLRLPFAMLSDPKLQLAEALDLPTFEAGGLAFLQETDSCHQRRRGQSHLLSDLPAT